MTRPLTCRDPACGHGGQRTSVGIIVNRCWLMVDRDAPARYGSDGRWYIRCASCGHETAWRGNLGRIERREMAA